MNRREWRQTIVEDLTRNVLDTEIWQKRPYTAVKVLVRYMKVKYVGFGFTKVCWPDTWDEAVGIERATRKAISDASHKALLRWPEPSQFAFVQS